jgi:hypothetical protein
MFRQFSRWFKLPHRRQHSKKTGPRAQLRLEFLEDRLAPAVFNVNTLADLSIASGVNPDGTIVGQGSTVTLRSAIQAANANTGAGGNTINLALAGTYKLTQMGTAGETDNQKGELSIFPTTPNGNLTIINISGGSATVDGNHQSRVFDIDASNTNNPATQFLVTMQGFTITNGDAQDPANVDGPTSTGGGIRDQGNTMLSLTNMVITNNVANADGGGVVMENTVNSTWTLMINNSTISNNHAGDAGGGIDTDGAGTVIINSGTVITGNTDVNQGAGVYIDAIQVGTTFVGAPMTMTGTIVSNNQALSTGTLGPPASGGSGGGISNAGNGLMTISSSTIANNFASGVGGGFSDENAQGTLNVSNSFFFGNAATGDGGGIQEGGPSTTITNTVIQGNTSGANGGGLFLNGSTVSILNSTIVGNTALGGGAAIELQTTGTGTTITNSTITANSATANAAAAGSANGGAIEAPGAFTGSLTLLNDTINGNFASTNGGGIFWAGTAGSIALQNTIVAGNFAATGPDANNPAGSFTDKGGNLIGNTAGNTGFTASTTQTGTAAAPLDPLLAALASNGGPLVGATGNQAALQTEALLPGSPAVDKGVASGAPATDERGLARPDETTAGAQPDIGAFETQDLTGNAAFVAALYRDLLHRHGDVTNPTDAGFWVNGLNAGTFSVATVAKDVSRSPEALGIVVDGLYRQLLGRASDPGGRTSFVSFLQGGGTVEQAIAAIVNSSEYQATNGMTDSAFIQSLYTHLLGRTGTSAEVASWLAVLPTIGRAGVVSGFLSSGEYRTDEVDQLYGNPLAPVTSVTSSFPDLLHRASPPSATEVSGWVTSGLDILTIEALFAGSPEYFSLGSTLTGGVFV